MGTATITARVSIPARYNAGLHVTAMTQVVCTAEAPLPDLSPEKSHAPDKFEFGGQGQFTVTVTNNGPGTATEFTLIDVLPGGLTAVAVSNSDWQCNPLPASIVDCLYVGPPLLPGDMAPLVITVSVGSEDELPERFENCAQVTLLRADGAPIDDADPSNDEWCDPVTVVGPAEGGSLWLEKVDQDGNPVPGAGFSITGFVGVTVCVPAAAGGGTCHVEDRPVGVALACTTDALGECHFEGLAAGDYVINETLIPAGYTFLGCEPKPATVPSAGGVTVRCRNEETQVEVPDLSMKKRHGSLDLFVQDDSGVDYIILECPGCVPTLFQAGLPDNFTGAPEPSSPSPALLARILNCSAGALQAFDPVPQNRCFGHTMGGLPEISAATLKIGLKAHATDPATDTDGLSLQLTSGGTTVVWSIPLNDLIAWWTAANPPLQLIWTPGSVFEFSLDLAALPLNASGSPTTSILSAINNFAFGGQGQFALMVMNNGPGPASGFTVTDILPPGLIFVSASNGDWSCIPLGQTVTCTYGGLPLQPGESAMVIITVAVGSPSDFTGGPVLNPVSIDVDNCATVEQLDDSGTVIADPDPSNDTVCDRVVMEGAAEEFGLVTVSIPVGTNLVSFPVEVTSADLIAAIPDLIVWFLRDGVWKVDSRALPLSLRVIIVIPVGSGIIAITDTGGVAVIVGFLEGDADRP